MASLPSNPTYQPEADISLPIRNIKLEPYRPVFQAITASPLGQLPEKSGGVPSGENVIKTLKSGGSFLSNPQNLGEVIKSTRDIDYASRNLYRQGLDARFYQVEHIMPLEFNGVNDSTNIQILFNEEHEKKTKVQNIISALYNAKKISLQEAQANILNWRDKNVEDVHPGEYGQVDIPTAVRKFSEWNAPVKVGAKEALVGLASELPLVGKFIKKNLTPGEKLYVKALEEGPEGALAQGAQALASAATFGWFPAPRRETTDVATQISKMTGGIVGSLIGFGWLGKGLGAISKVVGIEDKLNKSALGANLVKKLSSATAGKISPSVPVLNKIVQNAGLFAIGGQISKFEEDTFKNRMEQMFHDLTLGAVTGKAGLGVRGISTVGATSFALSYILGDDLENSFMNGAVMAGLHGIGGRIGQAKFEKMVNDESLKASYDFRKFYNDKVIEKPTRDQIINENEVIYKNIMQRANAGELSPDDVQVALKKMLISGNLLYTDTLPTTERNAKRQADMLSLASHINKPISESRNLPPQLNDFFNKNQDLLGGKSAPELKITPINPQDIIEGKIMITGYGKDINPTNRANMIKLTEAVHTGKHDGTVYLTMRPDLKWTVEEMNRNMDLKSIKRGEIAPNLNPEANVGVYAVLNGEVLPLGFIPRTERIEGLPYSINEQIRMHNSIYPDIPFPEFDPDVINNKVIYDKMNNLGTTTIKTKVNAKDISDGTGKYGLETVSKEPFIITEFSKPLWEESIARNKGLKTMNQMRAENVVSAIAAARSVDTKPHDVITEVKNEAPTPSIEYKQTTERNNVKELFDRITKATDEKSFVEVMKSELDVPEDMAKGLWNKENLQYRDIEMFLPAGSTDALKTDINFQRYWEGVESQSLFSAKKIEEARPKLELKQQEAKPVKPAFDINKVEAMPIEELQAEQVRRVEKFRKEAGMMAQKEGAGVKYRETERGMMKEFSLKRAKAQMAREKEALVGRAEEMLYENEPEFRKIQDALDRRLETEVDGTIETMNKLADEELAKTDVFGKLETINKQIDKEINNIEQYEQQSKEIGVSEVIEQKGEVGVKEKAQPAIQPEVIREEFPDVKQPPVIINNPQQPAEEVITKEVIKEKSNITEPQPTTSDLSKIKLLKDSKDTNEEINDTLLTSFASKKDGGGNQLMELKLRNKQIELRNKGDFKGALALENDKKFITREVLSLKAKSLMEKNNNDVNKAFDEFRVGLDKYFTEKTGDVLFSNERYVKKAKHLFTMMAYNESQNTIQIDPTGIGLKIMESTPDGESNFTKNIKEFEKANGIMEGSIKLVKIDLSKYTDIKKIAPPQRIDYLKKVMWDFQDSFNKGKDKFIPIGFKANGLDNFIALKYDPKVVDIYNKNPENYKFNYDKEGDLKTNQEKFFRVILKDVIKIQSDITASDLPKRLNLLDNKETVNLVPKQNYKHVILKSPQIRDLEKKYGQKLLHIPDNVNQDIKDSLLNFSAFDGAIYVLNPKYAKDIADFNGYTYVPDTFKPVMEHNINGNKIVSKGQMFIADKSDIEFFKEYYGLDDKFIQEHPFLMFTDDVKIGKGMGEIVGKDVTGNEIKSIDIPSDSYRFQYTNPPQKGASLSQSFIGRLDSTVADAVKQMNSKEFTKFKEFRIKFKEVKTSDELTKVFKDFYDINLEKSLFGEKSVAFKNGASKEYLKTQLEKIVNKIFSDIVLSGGNINSAHFKVKPDVGRMVNGKRVFLQPGENVISKGAKDFFSLTDDTLSIRYPISDPLNPSGERNFSGEDIGINKLGRELLVSSYHDFIIGKQGDWDGDSKFLYATGDKEGQVPRAIPDFIENKRKKNGDIFLKEPKAAKSKEKLSPTIENMTPFWEAQATGEDVINMTSAIGRIVSTLKENNVRFEILDNKKINVLIGDEKPKEGKVIFDIEYNKNTLSDLRDILQAGLDAVSSPEALASKKFTGMKYLVNKIVKPVTDRAKEIDLSDGHINFINKYISQNQTFHSLGQSVNTIPNDEYLTKAVNKFYNDVKILKDKGAKLSPYQEQVLGLGELESIIPVANDQMGALDKKAANFVVEKFKEPMKEIIKNKNVQDFKSIMRRARVEYASTKDSAKKTQIRDNVIMYFKNNYAKYTNDDIKGIAYIAAASNDGNLKWNPAYESKGSKYAYRYEEIIHQDPEISKTYYEGFRL